jgi:wobble nucleotide-excising tRNase
VATSIVNIPMLKGMGILADRTAKSPSLEFRQYNLIYGFNGSGKSTLSRLFASLEAGKPELKLPAGGIFSLAMDDGTAFASSGTLTGLEKRVLVFNGDFVEKNLQWTAGRANPVFFIGADQAEAATGCCQSNSNLSPLARSSPKPERRYPATCRHSARAAERRSL